MRGLFRIITLLICVELIVGPLAPQASLIQNSFAQSCNDGMQYDANLNRCITTTQAAQILTATANCTTKECYLDEANSALSGKEKKGEVQGSVNDMNFVSGVTNAVAVAGPLTAAVAGLSGMKGNTCSAVSFGLIVGGSASLFISDLLANLAHEKRLKGIRENWDKISKGDLTSTDLDKKKEAGLEAQGEAFEMLAQSEESLATAARTKATWFTVAAVAYGAAAVIAAVEAIWDPKFCKTDSKVSKGNNPKGYLKKSNGLFYAYSHPVKFHAITSQHLRNIKLSSDIESFIVNNKALELPNHSPSIDSFEELKKQFSPNNTFSKKDYFKIVKDISLSFFSKINPIQISDSLAESEATLWGGGSGVVTGVTAGLVFKKAVKKAMESPVTRIIYAGVMATMSGIMANHASKQAEASENRAEVLRQMKKEVEAGGNSLLLCKSENRNDPGKPSCYCYTPTGERNSNRGASTVCQNLWGSISSKTGKYQASANSSKICVTNSNKADPTCACKKTNSCMKVSAGGLKGVGPGTMSLLNSAISPLNQMTNGEAGSGSYTSENTGSLAARINALKEQVMKDPRLAQIKKNEKKESDLLMKQLQAEASKMNPSSFMGASSSSALPASPAEAVKQLEKELDKGPESVGNGNSVSVPVKEEKQLEFGMTDEQLAAQEDQVAEVMKENLDFGGNDINQGSNTNIFEVLSNRYQRSGMRRLFDEKGVTEPEKPASSDITK